MATILLLMTLAVLALIWLQLAVRPQPVQVRRTLTREELLLALRQADERDRR